MKTKTIFVIILIFFFKTTFAQYKGYWSYSAAADTKGEVIAVYFTGDVCKIWSLKDGQLLYNDKKDAFGYASKMLKYKIQNADWKKRNTSIGKGRMFDNSKGDSSESYEIKYGAEEFTRFNINVDYNGTSQVFLDVDNKICLFKDTDKGITTLYSVPYISSPDFKSGKKYICMKKILSRTNLKYNYLLDPSISPTGKYAFLQNYGVMIDLEKNKELWNITQLEPDGKYFDYNTFAFNTDETLIAISEVAASPNSVFIYSVNNGKKMEELTIPKVFQERLEYLKIYPASDMKSYIVDGKIKLVEERECWLVKADGTMLMLKVE